MKNSTKVRLHLSKQLFESLTREIIKEAKANDGYTVAVKQPKMPKQSKAQAASPEVQKTDKEATMGEMETKVAEKKDKVNEISSEEVAAIVGLLPGVGLTAAYIKDVLSIMKEKGLKGREGWKKASQEVGSDAKAHMDRTVGGNTPGQGHGVDTRKTFGPQNEKKEELKEYEHHYEVRNGECRRYNDEGEYTVVSMSYCR
jgi:hypothetical protein